MARTKADAGKKAGGKAARKAPVLRTTPVPKSGGVSKHNKRKGSGGTRNSACKRPVPKWQMPIGEFLTKAGSSKEAAAGAPSKEEEEEVDMEITEVHAPTTSVVCVSADSTVEEAADTSIVEDKAADTSIVEDEAADTSIVEDESADTSIDEDEAADTSIVEDEAAEKSMNGDKANEDEDVKNEGSAKNGSVKTDVQENGGKLKKEDGEVTVMDENSSDIEVVDEIPPKKANDVTKIPETPHDELKTSEDQDTE